MSSATRLKLLRTTAFKLAAGYLVVFGLFAAALVGYLVFETSSVLIRDVDARLTADARRLGSHYRRGGINGLFEAMQQSAMRPGNRLYALLDPDGRPIVNNFGVLPDGLANESGLVRFRYELVGVGGIERESRAIARVIDVPGGFQALIGVDIGQSDVIRQAILRAATISLAMLILLGLLGWAYVNRRVVRRIEGISDSTRRIMDGRLSERIAITGTGDEFDRLADQLNTMLERLERSMAGLKEVSDNIAHDLRTPLTRMRNQIEDALRQPANETADRAALEQSLQQADRLMATFQALLTIARVEAGGRRHTLSKIDLGPVLTDVIELYEPVAEDRGVTLSVTTPDTAIEATVNRELVGLALANLIDNALKYGPTEGGMISLDLKRVGDSAVFTIADNGPGIPEAERERVRDRFVRLDKSRSAEGSGLGLALVDAVAAFHDGALVLEDADPGLKAQLNVPLGGKASDKGETPGREAAQ
ncbi:MAG: HAMP domain-containing sensor histidine kinase [Pseudomonadota bacterium]